MNICGIYCIFNTANGKAYVGQSMNIAKRKSEHYRFLRLGVHDNEHLQRAWNKYREYVFEFRIIEECREDVLSCREIAWISYYKSHSSDYGYNKTLGGYRPKYTEQTRARMSLSHLGKKLSTKHRANISASSKGKINGRASKGKISSTLSGHTISAETRAKISASLTGKKQSKETILRRSIALRNPSSETRAKLSAASKSAWFNRKQKIAV